MPEHPENQHEAKISGVEFRAALVSGSMERLLRDLRYERPPEFEGRVNQAIKAMRRGDRNGPDGAWKLMNDYEEGGGSLKKLIEDYIDRNFEGFDDSDPWSTASHIDRATMWWENGFRKDGESELNEAAWIARESRKKRDVVAPEIAEELAAVAKAMMALRLNTPADYEPPAAPSPEELADMMAGHLSEEVRDEIRRVPQNEGLTLVATELATVADRPEDYLREHDLLVE